MLRYLQYSSLLAILLLSACAHTISRDIRTDQLGTKYARISGYLRTSGAAPGGAVEEQTPGHIRHDVLLDEATLMSIANGEACVNLVMRTASQRDEPIEQYNPTFVFNGRNAATVVEDEEVSVYDYDYTGEQETLSLEGVAAGRYMGLSLKEPAERVFRVIERRATVCGSLVESPDRVQLQLTHPNWDFVDWSYGVEFDWNLGG